MQEVTKEDRPFIGLKSDSLSEPVSDRTSNQQSHACDAPQLAKSLCTTLKYELTEQCKQNLSGSSSACPAHRDKSNAEDQGSTYHVAEAFLVGMPRLRRSF